MYIADTRQCTGQCEHASRISLHSSSSTPLNSGSIANWLCKVISSLVLGAIPRAHDVRKLSYPLTWARGKPIEEIVKEGFWSSANVTRKRALHARMCHSTVCNTTVSTKKTRRTLVK